MKKWIILVLALLCVVMLFVKTKPVFEIDNVSRITFYAYYGSGTGSDVPTEKMDEILNWLDSFSVGKKVPGMLPPGTNTVCVEIEYSDGLIIKQGLDTVEIGWITYYTKSDNPPDCFHDILSKTSLSD